MKIKQMIAGSALSLLLFSNKIYASEAQTALSNFKTIEPNIEIYTTAYLNVREEPSIDSESICILEPNCKLEKVEKNEEWTKIKINDKIYFVNNNYITQEQPNDFIIVCEVEPGSPGICESSDSRSGSSYLGYYRLTAYCPCPKCCGDWSGGLTSSGVAPKAGVTVGCNSISADTNIVINGHLYIVQDTGNMSSDTIDIFMNNHDEALQFGVQYADVYLAE